MGDGSAFNIFLNCRMTSIETAFTYLILYRLDRGKDDVLDQEYPSCSSVVSCFFSHPVVEDVGLIVDQGQLRSRRLTASFCPLGNGASPAANFFTKQSCLPHYHIFYPATIISPSSHLAVSNGTKS